MAYGPITSWQIDGEKVESVIDFLFLGSKITADGGSAMKLEDTCFLEGKLWQTEWKVKMKFAQSCLTPCDPMDYTVHGILQARILEWVAVPFSRGSSPSRQCIKKQRHLFALKGLYSLSYGLSSSHVGMWE